MLATSISSSFEITIFTISTSGLVNMLKWKFSNSVCERWESMAMCNNIGTFAHMCDIQRNGGFHGYVHGMTLFALVLLSWHSLKISGRAHYWYSQWRAGLYISSTWTGNPGQPSLGLLDDAWEKLDHSFPAGNSRLIKWLWWVGSHFYRNCL